MSRSYWKERERQKQARMDKVTDEQIERFRELLLASLDDLDKQIQKIYMKYAKDNNLDYHDALQYLTDDEKKEFQKDLQYYLEKAQNEQDRIQYKQELHALSVRHRVKRIEMLKANIQKHASILHDQLNTKTRKAISSLYPEGFLRGIYESVQGDDPDGVPLAEAINPSYVQEILETPWSGKNYSEKIWDLTADFEKKLSETLTQGLVQGKHPNEMARDFRKLGVGKEGTGGIVHRAETLMQTESAYIIEQATLKGYAATKIDEYEFMTAKDGKVCGICADINKERFPCGKAITGTNYPPMHPRCRCTTVPVTPYSNEDTNEQYVYETDYDEWYDTYCADAVDEAYSEWAKENGIEYEKLESKSKKSIQPSTKQTGDKQPDELEKKKRKTYSRTLKEQFDRYTKVLGPFFIPDNIDDFVKKKYNDKKWWSNIKAKYRIVNRYKVDYGEVSPEEILELDQIALNAKDNMPNKKTRQQGNIGVLRTDDGIHIAHSKVSKYTDSGYENFEGDKTSIILAKEDNQRHYSTAKKGELVDGVPSSNDRYVDSEAKFFEYLRDKYPDKTSTFTITILSERNMCQSCRGVYQQFITEYPNAKVNVVSGKKTIVHKKNKDGTIVEKEVSPWTWRKRKKKDTKKKKKG